MIRKFLILFTVVFALLAIPYLPFGIDAMQAQQGLSVGEMMPELKGRTLAGTELTIPTDTKGKATVLGLAFSQKAEGDLKGWVQPLYDAFLARHEGVFEAGNFDGNVYLAVMLSGMAASAGQGLLDKAAKNTDAELRPHVLVSKQDAAAVVAALGVKDKNKPYFAVLDSEGRITSIVSGSYTEAKMEELSDKAGEAE